MSLLKVIGVALGLSMDCMAVAMAAGLALKQVRLRDVLRVAGMFGFFQALMPALGWAATAQFRHFIGRWGHAAAFALLSAVGLKMIYESLRLKSKPFCFDSSKFGVLLMLSVATSVDALAAGVGLALSLPSLSLAMPAALIGCTAFLCSAFGMLAGGRLGRHFESGAEAAGGAILLAIALKMLIAGASAGA